MIILPATSLEAMILLPFSVGPSPVLFFYENEDTGSWEDNSELYQLFDVDVGAQDDEKSIVSQITVSEPEQQCLDCASKDASSRGMRGCKACYQHYYRYIHPTL